MNSMVKPFITIILQFSIFFQYTLRMGMKERGN